MRSPDFRLAPNPRTKRATAASVAPASLIFPSSTSSHNSASERDATSDRPHSG